MEAPCPLLFRYPTTGFSSSHILGPLSPPLQAPENGFSSSHILDPLSPPLQAPENRFSSSHILDPLSPPLQVPNNRFFFLHSMGIYLFGNLLGQCHKICIPNIFSELTLVVTLNNFPIHNFFSICICIYSTYEKLVYRSMYHYTLDRIFKKTHPELSMLSNLSKEISTKILFAISFPSPLQYKT